MVADYEVALPSATACFTDDFEACIAHLQMRGASCTPAHALAQAPKSARQPHLAPRTIVDHDEFLEKGPAQKYQVLLASGGQKNLGELPVLGQVELRRINLRQADVAFMGSASTGYLLPIHNREADLTGQLRINAAFGSSGIGKGRNMSAVRPGWAYFPMVVPSFETDINKQSRSYTDEQPAGFTGNLRRESCFNKRRWRQAGT